jgi:hypothetical protein
MAGPHWDDLVMDDGRWEEGWRKKEVMAEEGDHLGPKKTTAVELGYNIMKGTEYFVSL